MAVPGARDTARFGLGPEKWWLRENRSTRHYVIRHWSSLVTGFCTGSVFALRAQTRGSLRKIFGLPRPKNFAPLCHGSARPSLRRRAALAMPRLGLTKATPLFGPAAASVDIFWPFGPSFLDENAAISRRESFSLAYADDCLGVRPWPHKSLCDLFGPGRTPKRSSARLAKNVSLREIAAHFRPKRTDQKAKKYGFFGRPSACASGRTGQPLRGCAARHCRGVAKTPSTQVPSAPGRLCLPWAPLRGAASRRWKRADCGAFQARKRGSSGA